jgi:hypothetical protein
VWLSDSPIQESHVVQRIFADNHPAVAVAALDGCIAGWATYDDGTKALLLELILETAGRPTCAAALLPRLVVFDRVEYTGANPPWVIFARAMPAVLRSLPPDAIFSDAHLLSCMREAVGHMESGSAIAICSEWITLLQREIHNTMPSEFFLAVTEVLIRASRSAPSERTGLIERLLTIQSTSASLVFVADLVDAWFDLIPEEQALLVALLQTQRVDKLWSNAVALTRKSVPPEIQFALLGTPQKLSDPPRILLADLPSDLVNACVAVYCGRPQPLWWLGTHHVQETPWDQLVRAIGLEVTHPLFETALDEAVLKQDGTRLAEIVNNAGRDNADRIFNLLLQRKV